jgi:hypothetical protein
MYTYNLASSSDLDSRSHCYATNCCKFLFNGIWMLQIAILILTVLWRKATNFYAFPIMLLRSLFQHSIGVFVRSLHNADVWATETGGVNTKPLTPGYNERTDSNVCQQILQRNETDSAIKAGSEYQYVFIWIFCNPSIHYAYQVYHDFIVTTSFGPLGPSSGD